MYKNQSTDILAAPDVPPRPTRSRYRFHHLHRIFLDVLHLCCVVHTSSAATDVLGCGLANSLATHGAWPPVFEALSVIPLTLGIGHYELFGFGEISSILPYALTILLKVSSVHIPRHFAKRHNFGDFIHNWSQLALLSLLLLSHCR